MLHALAIVAVFAAIFIFAVLAGGGLLGDALEEISEDDLLVGPDEHEELAH
jgi:hypothetical protein